MQLKLYRFMTSSCVQCDLPFQWCSKSDCQMNSQKSGFTLSEIWNIINFMILSTISLVPQKSDCPIKLMQGFGVGEYTLFALITTHTPISTQSSNSVVFKLQPVYFQSISLRRHVLWVPI